MLVTTDSGVVVNITGLGHANHRMNEQIGFIVARRTESQFDVGTVHRVAGLESDYLAPTKLSESLTRFRGCIAQCPEIVVARGFQATQLAAQVDGMRRIHQVIDAGMRHILGAEYRLSFPGFIRRPVVGDFERRD